MGFSTISVPFFSDEIKMTEITEASSQGLFKFEGKRLRALGVRRLNMSSLDKVIGPKAEYILTFSNKEFIRFVS